MNGCYIEIRREHNLQIDSPIDRNYNNQSQEIATTHHSQSGIEKTKRAGDERSLRPVGHQKSHHCNCHLIPPRTMNHGPYSPNPHAKNIKLALAIFDSSKADLLLNNACCQDLEKRVFSSQHKRGKTR